MIQSNEVRRGNLVEYEGRVFEIDIIAEEFPTLNTQEFGIGVVSWKDLGGVMLTEAVLDTITIEKVVKNECIVLYRINDWYVGLDSNKWCLYLQGSYELEPIAFGERFEFVHQLQNLIFSLTGEELTIKG